MSKRWLLLLAIAGGPATTHARPLEAVESDRNATQLEMDDLERRAASLDDQIGLRQRMLKKRVRALYKLSQGGALRLIVEAKNPAEIEERFDGAQRVISRDLRELASLGDELDELARDRALRGEEEQRSAQLAVSGSEPARGLELRRGDLARPVPGAIVTGLSHVRVPNPGVAGPPIELPRRAVELATSPGDAVRAVASGTVRWIGSIDGLSQVVVIDHGEHYTTLTGRLRTTELAIGTPVREGQLIGRADASTVTFELAEARTSLDPARWLRPPPPPHPLVAPTHASLAGDHNAPL